MNGIIDNFKRITLFRIIALASAVLVIVGVFPTFAAVEGMWDISLIKGLPIGGIIVILASLTIIAGVALANKIVSIVGAGVALASDIVLSIIMKSSAFNEKIMNRLSEDYLGLTPGGAPSADDLGFEGEAADTYNQGLDFVDDMIDEGIKEAFSCKIGFYLILIGAVLALAAMIIDLIKGDKAIEEKIMETAGSISGAASAVMANTANEYSESNHGNSPRTHFSIKQENPWTCKECGKENDGKSQFCVYCGNEKPGPKICYKCGALMEDHMMFCPKCGTEYDDEKAKEVIEDEKTEAPEPQKHVCKYCGAELPEGALFCGKCGREQ